MVIQIYNLISLFKKIKKICVYFLAYDVFITQIRNSNLGKHSPGGDRVLCIRTDVTSKHIKFSGRAFAMIS